MPFRRYAVDWSSLLRYGRNYCAGCVTSSWRSNVSDITATATASGAKAAPFCACRLRS